MTRLVHIVDDDAEVRAGLSFMLRQRGYETEIYSGGPELLARKRLTRGCVLLDVRMPQMDGFEVLAELVKRGVDLPVIVLTGHGDVPLAVRAMKRGVVDFLEQPYEPEQLVEAIDRALAIAELSREAREARADALAKLSLLTPRETQILQGLRAGMANKTMARWLGLSPRTVETYRANMMAKMGVARLSQAIRVAADGDLRPIEVQGSGNPSSG